jgi:hypothetical protein
VGTEGPEMTRAAVHREEQETLKVTLKRTVLRMTSEESEIPETAFFVYERLK